MRGFTISGLALLATSSWLDSVVATRHDARLKHLHPRAAGSPGKTTVWKVYTDLVIIAGSSTSTSLDDSPDLSTQYPDGDAAAPKTTAAAAPVVSTQPATSSVSVQSSVAPVVSAGDSGALALDLKNKQQASKQYEQPKSVITTTTTKSPPPASSSVVAPVQGSASGNGGSSSAVATSAMATTAQQGTPSTNPAPVTNSGLQKGVGWNWDTRNSISQFKGHVQFFQNWDAWSPQKLQENNIFGELGQIDYTPMLWGYQTPEIEHVYIDFEKNVEAYFAAHTPSEKIILTLNEPDMNAPGCSNVQPAIAAQVWKDKIVAPGFDTKYSVVSPSFTSRPEGLKWYQDWQKACGNACKSTYTGAHYYNSCTVANAAKDAAAMVTYFRKIYEACGSKPLIVSEFGCYDGSDPAGVVAFQKAAIPAMQGASDILRRYTWHGAVLGNAGSMIDNPALGTAWINA